MDHEVSRKLIVVGEIVRSENRGVAIAGLKIAHNAFRSEDDAHAALA
jgi:hypothetical protein